MTPADALMTFGLLLYVSPTILFMLESSDMTEEGVMRWIMSKPSHVLGMLSTMAQSGPLFVWIGSGMRVLAMSKH